MQERFYESGNCVQKNCAILGVHPRELGPTWSQNSGQLAPFSSLSSGRATESTRFMERAMGIEPTSEAWEASILPLYDARLKIKLANWRGACKGPGQTQRAFLRSGMDAGRLTWHTIFGGEERL